MDMDKNALLSVVGLFDIRESVNDVRPLGAGLINDTYLVETACGPRYVLQRINNAIFKDVPLLQHNIEAVTGHIRANIVAAGETDPDRKVLRYIPLKTGPQTYCEVGGNFWRMSVFVKDSVTLSEVNPSTSYATGRAFGQFETMLADLREPLGETIPDFHNMELRSRQLREAVAADRAGRVHEPEVQQLLDVIAEYDAEMCKAEQMHRDGILPKRICHCDPKVNNILFDADGNILCVIDLDTVMPSFVFSDFGDFLRTGANTVAEDSPEYDKVEFRMDIYEAFRKGYLETATFLTDVEKDNLPFAARLFPYMQAVRFLADYLNADVYYKISYPEHNLVRTKNQLALFLDATRKLKEA